MTTNNEHDLCNWIEELLGSDSPAAAAFRASADEKPGRISAAYRELLSGYETTAEELVQVTASLSPTETYDGLVQAEGIYFVSICAHHFLPFFGTVDLTYHPGNIILGIGKLPRLVAMRSRRFQIQEYLVQELCRDLMGPVGAQGAFVSSRAQHMCICGRGPSCPEVETVTTYGAGTLRNWAYVKQS